MTETPETNVLTLKIELPQVVNDALKPLATAVGETLSNLWNGAFIDIHTWYGKKKIESDLNLQAYKNRLQENINSIPEENLQEPKMNIIGPALEASKFYFEEEIYRELFSKLIAGSFDNRKNDHIHPYFVEAIKQMTPQDAYIISLFKDAHIQPIAKYVYVNNETESTQDWISLVFLSEKNEETAGENAQSISNLVRLGLLEVSFIQELYDKSLYEIHKKHPSFLEMKKSILDGTATFSTNVHDLDVVTGLVQITPLGMSFINICM